MSNDQNKFMSLDYLTKILERTPSEFQKEFLNELPKYQYPLYIVAREYRHAEYLARANGLKKKDWNYVGSADALRGARGQVVFYGPWYELREARKIEDYVNALHPYLEIIEMSDKPSKVSGVDFARGPDKTVISAPCPNCEVYRVIENGVMQKCPNCGDDETDLNEEIQIP